MIRVNNADKLTICQLQFIIDNPEMNNSKIARKFNNRIKCETVRKIRLELGITSRYRKRSPESIAEGCGYDVFETAAMLEKHGYGDMSMSEVLQICG